MILSPWRRRRRRRRRREGRASVVDPWRPPPLSRFFFLSCLATNCRCRCLQMMRGVRPRPYSVTARGHESRRRWQQRLRPLQDRGLRLLRQGEATVPPEMSPVVPSKDADERFYHTRPRPRLARSLLSGGAAIGAFPPLGTRLPVSVRPPMPRATTRSAITVFAIVMCCHAAYTALLHRALRGRFLAMVLLSEVASVPDYGDGGRVATTGDGGDVGGGKKKSASERLPRIIRELRFVGSDVGLDNEVAGAQSAKAIGAESGREVAWGADRLQVLWDGYLLYACAGRSRLADGWYATGDIRGGSHAVGRRGGGVSSVLRVRVSGEGRTATVYIHRPAGARRPPSTSDLLRRRRPLCIVEDLEDRLAWRRVLGDARRSACDARSPAPPPPTSASYSFVYRDYVGVEEKFVMVGRRGGLSPLRLTEDTALTLHDDGTCTLVDSGSILGLLPVRTRNVGRWYGGDSPLGAGDRVGGGCCGGGVGVVAVPPHWIEWESSSLRIGWGSRSRRPWGRTVEMRGVTDALRAGPWPVLSLPVTGDDPDGGEDEVLLLVNRPSYGWLVFSAGSRVNGRSNI